MNTGGQSKITPGAAVTDVFGDFTLTPEFTSGQSKASTGAAVTDVLGDFTLTPHLVKVSGKSCHLLSCISCASMLVYNVSIYRE